MESTMTINLVTPQALALVSDTIQAYCRQHECDGRERVEIADQAYRLYCQGYTQKEALLDRLNTLRRRARTLQVASTF